MAKVTKEYNDYPLYECGEEAQKVLDQNPTALIFQKWTCRGCGDRVTANEPNYWTTWGKHEDCGYTTNIKQHGCNYMVCIPGRMAVS